MERLYFAFMLTGVIVLAPHVSRADQRRGIETLASCEQTAVPKQYRVAELYAPPTSETSAAEPDVIDGAIDAQVTCPWVRPAASSVEACLRPRQTPLAIVSELVCSAPIAVD